MDIDCEIVEILKLLAPWVAIFVSIVVLIIQMRRARFSQSIDLTLKLEQRFSGSEDILKARKKAAETLQSNMSSPSTDVDDILDFFDTIGLLVRKKALDKEMVWHTFYYWLHRYSILLEDYIAKRRKTSPATWEDMVDLEKAVVSLELKRCKSKADIEITDDDLKEFLAEECSLEAKTANNSIHTDPRSAGR